MAKRDKCSKPIMQRPSVKPEGFLFLCILLAALIIFLTEENVCWDLMK